MSNQVSIIRTVFRDFATGDETFGFRVYDDHGQDYCNLLQKDDLEREDKEFLQRVKANRSEVIDSLIDFVFENEKGVFVDDTFYQFAEFKEMWGN